MPGADRISTPATVPPADQAAAWVGGFLATGLQQVTDDVGALDQGGRWVLAVTFEGQVTAAQFEHWTPWSAAQLPGGWLGPQPGQWHSSMDANDYRAAVDVIRDHISRGEVYQANLCRIVSAPVVSDPQACDPLALAGVLGGGNPAPYAGALRLPGVAADDRDSVMIACASPELYLSREGQAVLSRPIKGTASAPGGFLEKDTAENVMIVDLVRNDLGILAEPGSVHVPEFLHEEQHPGLVHLVSGVQAMLRPGVGWADLLAATFPPGSVTGAPKLAALDIIADLEPVPRGPYCGAFGWVDTDRGTAELAVAIRTFWIESDDGGRRWLKFGTGAGITWGSDAELEWRETELKAARLVALASGVPVPDLPMPT